MTTKWLALLLDNYSLISFCHCSIFCICFQMSPVQQPQTSPLLSPQSILPLLTSTLEKPSMLLSTQSPFPEGSASHSCLYDFSQVSSVSQVSLSLSSIQSSVRSNSVKDAAALARKKEVVLYTSLFDCSLIRIEWMHRCCDLVICVVFKEITYYRPSWQKSPALNAAAQTLEPHMSGKGLDAHKLPFSVHTH